MRPELEPMAKAFIGATREVTEEQARKCLGDMLDLAYALGKLEGVMMVHAALQAEVAIAMAKR